MKNWDSLNWEREVEHGKLTFNKLRIQFNTIQLNPIQFKLKSMNTLKIMKLEIK